MISVVYRHTVTSFITWHRVFQHVHYDLFRECSRLDGTHPFHVLKLKEALKNICEQACVFFITRTNPIMSRSDSINFAPGASSTVSQLHGAISACKSAHSQHVISQVLSIEIISSPSKKKPHFCCFSSSYLSPSKGPGFAAIWQRQDYRYIMHL